MSIQRIGLLWGAVTTFLLLGVAASGQDEVFSGPQVGEELVAFEMQGVYGELEFKELRFEPSADVRSTMLVFVHEFNEPCIGMAYKLAEYAAQREPEEVTTTIVFLTAEPAEMIARLQRFRRPWPARSTVAVSVDGEEGPGVYGLNRNVGMTILVSQQQEVAANHSLIQPSVRGDAVAVLADLVTIIGGTPPTEDDLFARDRHRRQAQAEMQKFLAVVAFEGVDNAAMTLERYVEDNPETREPMGQLAASILRREIYAESSRAHDYLERWAREYGSDED